MDVLTVTKVGDEFRVHGVEEFAYAALMTAIKCLAAQRGMSDGEMLDQLRLDLVGWDVWGTVRDRP